MRQVDGLSKRDLPLLREVHSQLEASIPEQSSTGIVHGDYRLDNCIVDDEGQIAAVLDWELCTLGDTRADLGTLIVYWAEPEDDFFPLTTPPTIVDGFARRRDLVEIYTKAAGEEVEGLEYFVAFSYWRLACILEGVYARYSAAAMGKAVPKNLESFTRGVDRLTQRAADILGGAPPFAA
ncbi:MAG: phosphotransferase family protein, partial [Myxococcota bacterium]